MHGLDMHSAWTYGIDIVHSAWTYGIDMDSWHRHGLMVYTWTHRIDKDCWYRYILMVLTTPMVLT